MKVHRWVVMTIKANGIVYQLQRSLFGERVVECFPGCIPGKSRIGTKRFRTLSEKNEDLNYGLIEI